MIIWVRESLGHCCEMRPCAHEECHTDILIRLQTSRIEWCFKVQIHDLLLIWEFRIRSEFSWWKLQVNYFKYYPAQLSYYQLICVTSKNVIWKTISLLSVRLLSLLKHVSKFQGLLFHLNTVHPIMLYPSSWHAVLSLPTNIISIFHHRNEAEEETSFLLSKIWRFVLIISEFI